MRPLYKLIDFFLYSNLWIALAAVAMSLQTELVLRGRLQFGYLEGFILSATLFLYALHRLIAIRRLPEFTAYGRYQTIQQTRYWIMGYAGIAGLLCFWCFLHLGRAIQLTMLLPAFLSLGYVLPIFGSGRRLRDLHYLKIFLVAIVWALITVGLPARYYHLQGQFATWLMLAERTLFIFAITLPFDIRDLEVDAHTSVKTLPGKLGIRKTKALAIGSLTLMLLLVMLNYLKLEAYTTSQAIALLLSVVITLPLIVFADKNKHDYYFTGLLDGSMVFQFLLLYFLSLKLF